LTEWVSLKDALVIHAKQIAEHGGLPGILDQGLLESALEYPKQLAFYDIGKLRGAQLSLGIAALAAAYAVRIVQNHSFVDGNKRTSAVVTELFLELNGHSFIASVDDETIVEIWMRIAKGIMSQDELTQWMLAHIEVQ
jgi:death on curing protein